MLDKKEAAIVNQAIDVANCFGLGYISAVKENLEAYGIEFNRHHEAYIANIIIRGENNE